MLSIIDFCNKNEIKWFPNNINKKKEPIIPVKHQSYNNCSNNIPVMTDFKDLTNEEIKSRHQALNICNNLVIDTNRVCQLDIDSQEAYDIFKFLLEDNPYFLSINKKLPHIFCLVDEEFYSSNRHEGIKPVDFDLLTGQWGYCGKDILIHNSDKPIKHIDTNIIRKYLKPINKKNTKTKPNKKIIKPTIIEEEHKNDIIINQQIEDANDKYIKLMDIMKQDYIKTLQFKEWINIGLALYNTDNTLFYVFDYFSKKSEYYNYDGCLKTWNSFKDTNNDKITIGSIIYNLKKIYKTDTQIWCRTYNNNIDVDDNKYNIDIDINKLLDNDADIDCANLYYELNKDEYIIAQVKDKYNWFGFDEYNKLIDYGNKAPSKLINTVSTDIRRYLELNLKNIKPPINNNNNDEYKKNLIIYEKKTEQYSKLWKSIGTSKRVKGIIEYLPAKYVKPDILKMIDDNIKLISYKNKVFDLDINDFRDIRRTDYIIKNVGYDYNPNIDNSQIEYINKLLLSIFNTTEMIDYYMSITGMALFSNKFESFYCLTGSGGNGKSLLSTLLNKAIGDYMQVAEPSFMTTNYSSPTNPTLAKSKGIRYLLIAEPTEDAKGSCELNIAFLKAITGGEAVTSRDLYQSTLTFKPQFTPFLQCNEKPTIKKMDGGLKRRIKVVNFENKFVDNPNPNNKNERLRDYDIKDNINKDNELARHFLHILIQYAIKHKKDGAIKIPSVCNEATIQYIEENNNKIKSFISERYTYVVKVKKEDTKIYLKHLLQELNDISNIVIKSQNELIDLLKANNIDIKQDNGHYVLKNYTKIIDVSDIDE